MLLIIWHCLDPTGKLYAYFTTLFEGSVINLQAYLQKEPTIPAEMKKSVDKFDPGKRTIFPVSVCRVPANN